MTKKYFGYIRVSTLEQKKKGAGAEAQADLINKWAQLHEVKLEHVYKDLGVSGAKKSRPAFDKLLAAAEAAGEAGVIMCAYLSRFGRNLRDLLNNVERLDKAGVRLVAINDNIDTGDKGTGRLMLHILAAVAEYQRDLTRELITGGKAAKEAAGTFYNGSPPFGYAYSKKNFEFIKHDAAYVASLPEDKRPHYTEADTYLRIVGMYLDKGMAFDKIADIMTTEGIKLSHTGVREMLARECYYTGRITRTGLQGQTLRYTLPKLISASRWAQIAQRLHTNRHKAKRGDAHPERWLKNVLQCEKCGDMMKPRTHSQTGATYYSCIAKNQSKAMLHRRGRERCTLPNIPADDIEQIIWGRVCAKIAMFDETRKALADKITSPEAWHKKVNEHRQAANGFRAQIAKAQRAKGRLFDMLEAEDFGPEQQATFKDRLGAYDKDIAKLEAMVEEAEANAEQALDAEHKGKAWHKLLTESPELLEQLAQEVATLKPEHRQLVIESMLTGPITVEGEAKKGGQPADWYASNHLQSPNPAVFEQLAEAGALPVLKQLTRKQLALIHNFWKLAA